MIVSMWMTKNLVTVEPHTTLTEAAALMASRRIRRLPVVEHRADGPHLVGIVSAKDILHAFPPDINPFAVLAPEGRLAPATVAHIMSRRLHTTTPETPVEEAAGLMADKKIGALPVVRDARPVGLITEFGHLPGVRQLFRAAPTGSAHHFDVSKGEDVVDWVSQLSRRRNLRVLSLITSQQDGVPVCVARIAGKATEELLDDIWNSGHRVLNVIRYT